MAYGRFLELMLNLTTVYATLLLHTLGWALPASISGCSQAVSKQKQAVSTAISSARRKHMFKHGQMNRLIDCVLMLLTIVLPSVKAWITLSKQGLTVTEADLHMQSNAQVEGDLLARGAVRAADYNWISGGDSLNQQACDTSQIGALRWRSTTSDFFEACDGLSGVWKPMSFCDKDCGFPDIPASKVRAYDMNGPANCFAQLCQPMCEPIINPKLAGQLSSRPNVTLATYLTICREMLASNTSNLTITNISCPNISIAQFYHFSDQAVPNNLQSTTPDLPLCIVSLSQTCEPQTCATRPVLNNGWDQETAISGTRWILVQDPVYPLYKFAREEGLYIIDGQVYATNVTLHDIFTYELAGELIWPIGKLATSSVGTQRLDFASQDEKLGAHYRSTQYTYVSEIKTVWDASAFKIQPTFGQMNQCEDFDFDASAFHFLKIFYNSSNWDRLLPPSADNTSPPGDSGYSKIFEQCRNGFQASVPGPWWVVNEEGSTLNPANLSGSLATGSPLFCKNGTCQGMNCSVSLFAPPGYLLQLRLHLSIDLKHKGDAFILEELTTDGESLVLFNQTGDNVVTSNATIINITNCSSFDETDPNCENYTDPGKLVVATRFGSTLKISFVTTNHSSGLGFNATYDYISRISLMNGQGNATTLQYALALLEAQGANMAEFHWKRNAAEISSPSPSGFASLGNVTDAEQCFICYYYNGSCDGVSACSLHQDDCGNISNSQPLVDGSPFPPPWSEIPQFVQAFGAAGLTASNFDLSIFADEIPAVSRNKGYQPSHFIRTQHVSAYPPGTVKVPYGIKLGPTPSWGPKGDADPSEFANHPYQESLGWGLTAVEYGFEDLPKFVGIRIDIFGNYSYPGQPLWRIGVPQQNLIAIAPKRWDYDLDHMDLPPYSFVDADRRLVIANELAMFYPCGILVNNTCGVGCNILGTAINLIQCSEAVQSTRCNQPVVDACQNDCGTVGELDCGGSATPMGGLRIGSSTISDSTATFEFTTALGNNSEDVMQVSYFDPSEQCDPSQPGFDPLSSSCFYTGDGASRVPYYLSPEQLRIVLSKSDIDLPVPNECTARIGPPSPNCKLNDPLNDIQSAYTWKLDGRVTNLTIPWWDADGKPDKRASWAEIQAIVTRNAEILKVIYVKDMHDCLQSCQQFGNCQSSCLARLAASIMMAYGVDSITLKACGAPARWPLTFSSPPSVNFLMLSCLDSATFCADVFLTCFVSAEKLIALKADFEARRRTMMLQIFNKPGFKLFDMRRLPGARRGIELANPFNPKVNKPQQLVSNTLRISYAQQLFEKDVQIGSGNYSRIFFEAIVAGECPFSFAPDEGGMQSKMCVQKSTLNGISKNESGTDAATITLPDVSGVLITSQTPGLIKSLPGLRKRKISTMMNTAYPKYGLWPLPKIGKVPDLYQAGETDTVISQRIRPFQGSSSRYCGYRADGTAIVCEKLQQEYDFLEGTDSQQDESFIYTGEALVFGGMYTVKDLVPAKFNLTNCSKLTGSSKNCSGAVQNATYTLRNVTYLINATTRIAFTDPNRHQKLIIPDVSAKFITTGNLQDIKSIGIQVSPIVAKNSNNAWTRLKFGVPWETVSIKADVNDRLDYSYTAAGSSFCRPGFFLPNIMRSGSFSVGIGNLANCQQGSAILFDMGFGWPVEDGGSPPGQTCVSLYDTNLRNDSLVLLLDVNTKVMLTTTLQRNSTYSLWNVTMKRRICKTDVFGYSPISCAASSTNIQINDPISSDSSLVASGRYRYVLCTTGNSLPVMNGTWNFTTRRSIYISAGLYSLQNITDTLNSVLSQNLPSYLVTLAFLVRHPGEGLCGEAPPDTTYHSSSFLCAAASPYVELSGSTATNLVCQNISTCDSPSQNFCENTTFCENVSLPFLNVQVFSDSTILPTLGIPTPALAYTFGLRVTGSVPQGSILHPTAPGAAYLQSGYGHQSGFGLGGSPGWTGFIPPNPLPPTVYYTCWCHDGYGYDCSATSAPCETKVVTFSRVLGSTKTRDGSDPTDNRLIVPSSADGVVLSTGNLEDIFVNSSAMTGLRIDALRDQSNAIAFDIGRWLNFSRSSFDNKILARAASDLNSTSVQDKRSGINVTDGILAIHSYQRMMIWIALYNPNGGCPDQVYNAASVNDTVLIWEFLLNGSECVNRTFAPLQDTASQIAAGQACQKYCALQDSSKEQAYASAQDLLNKTEEKASQTLDSMLDDTRKYCVVVGCNSSTQTFAVTDYNDPASVARQTCKSAIVCKSTSRCSTEVKGLLVRRPPPYDFSSQATLTAWDICIRMMKLDDNVTTTVPKPNSPYSYQAYQSVLNAFPALYADALNQVSVGLLGSKQRCTCVEIEGFSSGVQSDVQNHVCQQANQPFCESDSPVELGLNGSAWSTMLKFSPFQGSISDGNTNFLVVPFTSGIILSSTNLEDVNVASGSMTSLYVKERSSFLSAVKLGMVREGVRSRVISHGSRGLAGAAALTSPDRPNNECEGCTTAGTCNTVCGVAVDQVVIAGDGLYLNSNISEPNFANAPSILLAASGTGLHRISFPTWDSDLCNGFNMSSCNPRDPQNQSIFQGAVVTNGDLNQITELNPNLVSLSGPDSISTVLNGEVQIGSSFSCAAGSAPIYGWRGWSVFAGANCVGKSYLQAKTKLANHTVDQCKQVCQMDPLCGILVIKKSGRQGLERQSQANCYILTGTASSCAVISDPQQDLYLNFREAPWPWQASQSSNAFFQQICNKTNVSSVPGTPIQLSGYINGSITWRPQSPYSWKYFPKSICDDFSPNNTARTLRVLSNISDVAICKSQCLEISNCGVVTMFSALRKCYLSTILSDRRILPSAGASCAGRDVSTNKVLNVSCVIQGVCSIQSNAESDLYVYRRNEGITLSFELPTQKRVLSFPDTNGVVITTGNLYDIPNIQGLQGSDVFQFAAPNFSFFNTSLNIYEIRYADDTSQLRTFRSSAVDPSGNYIRNYGFSGSQFEDTAKNQNLLGYALLRECDMTPSTTVQWKVANPSFQQSGLPDRDCYANVGCVLYTNIVDPTIRQKVMDALHDERNSRPGTQAVDTVFRDIYVGNGSGFDDFSVTVDVATPGSRVTQTTCLKTCAGGLPCERGLGYLPCQRATKSCHSGCPGYMYPRTGIAYDVECGFDIAGSVCGCVGGTVYGPFGTSVCVMPNTNNSDNGRFCTTDQNIPDGWISADGCCRNPLDKHNCGACTAFPPFIPADPNSNRITFPDISGTVITTGNMDDLTLLTINLNNLVVTGDLDFGQIDPFNANKPPSFGDAGYHKEYVAGREVWFTLINLDPYTAKFIVGLPWGSGTGSPAIGYFDPVKKVTNIGTAQLYPYTYLKTSGVSRLNGTLPYYQDLYCVDSQAFQAPSNPDLFLDRTERLDPDRCFRKRELLLPDVSGTIMLDSALHHVPSISIPRESLLLQQTGSSLEIHGNLTFGYRQNYSTDPANSNYPANHPQYRGLGVSGMELTAPREVPPFYQTQQSVLRAYTPINGDIGLRLRSASDHMLELPQSREVHTIKSYGENCENSNCTFSKTLYGGAAPTAEVTRFAEQGRMNDGQARRFERELMDLSPAHLEGIDTVMRAFLREGAPDLQFFVQAGSGILGLGAVYDELSYTTGRPIIELQRTLQPFIADPKQISSKNQAILPAQAKMLSQDIVITPQYCFDSLSRVNVTNPRDGRPGAVSRSVFFSYLMTTGIIIRDPDGNYAVNRSAITDPKQLNTMAMMKCAAYGYIPLWLENDAEELAIPESSGIILTTGSLEDIAGTVTSLSVIEDLTVKGDVTFGQAFGSSKLEILSALSASTGLTFSGDNGLGTTTTLTGNKMNTDSFVYVPDGAGTLVLGELPATMGNIDMLVDARFDFESSVTLGGATSMGSSLDRKSSLTIHSTMVDAYPFKFAGAVDNSVFTTLRRTDPGADNVIMIPDESGTLITSDDLTVLRNVTAIEKIYIQGQSVLMNDDVHIGGPGRKDLLEINAHILGLNALSFDGQGRKDGRTLILSAADPAAHNEITLPDCSGTIITSGNFPSVLEKLHLLDSFSAVGPATFNGLQVLLGRGDPGESTMVEIRADLNGLYPLVFDGSVDSSTNSATTSLSMQTTFTENIITFPDTSGTILTTSNIPSAVVVDRAYTLNTASIMIASNQTVFGRIESLPVSGAFLFADASCSSVNLASLKDNSFTVHATGGVYFFTAVSKRGNYIGASLMAAAGGWSYVSDRNAKRNIQPVNNTEVLRKLVQMPISFWQYDDDDDAQGTHIGPYAQDFAAAFELGADQRRIVSSDADGVILGSIQGMFEMVQEARAQRERLQAVVRLQRRRLEEQAARIALHVSVTTDQDDRINRLVERIGRTAMPL